MKMNDCITKPPSFLQTEGAELICGSNIVLAIFTHVRIATPGGFLLQPRAVDSQFTLTCELQRSLGGRACVKGARNLHPRANCNLSYKCILTRDQLAIYTHVRIATKMLELGADFFILAIYTHVRIATR